MRWRPVVSMCVALAVMAACGGGDAPTVIDADVTDTDNTSAAATTVVTTTAPAPSTVDTSSTTVPAATSVRDMFDDALSPQIDWVEVGGGVDTAVVEAPIDHTDHSAGTLELFVARHRATSPDDRIGVMFVNPGGPGFGGSIYAQYADQVWDDAIIERFDVIGWDPRGTGESRPVVDCIDDYDPYFAEIDITPETDDERATLLARSQEFADRCTTEVGDLIAFLGTNHTAADIDWLRRGLGEEQVTYFGFSYGSELGATWATLFPDSVRAAVLDGAADPDADPVESTLQQLTGFEASLGRFLASCSARSACAFHNDGDAEGAFDALMAQLDADPVPTDPSRPPANLAVGINAVIQAMYSESFWPRLERALADAARGDGSGLLALHDSYFQRAADGTWGNELEAFQVISCADTTERLSPDDEDALVQRYREVAPRLVPDGSVGVPFCGFLPAPADDRAEVSGVGAGPIVVIGTTGDPATPLASTRAMAAALDDGRLVVVDAEEHTGYGLNSCVIDVVNDYLVDLSPPDDNTDCG